MRVLLAAVILLAGCTSPDPAAEPVGQALGPGDLLGVATAHANGTVPAGHPLQCGLGIRAPVPVDYVMASWPLAAELPPGVQYEFRDVRMVLTPTSDTNVDVNMALYLDGQAVARSDRFNAIAGQGEEFRVARLDPGDYDLVIEGCLGAAMDFRLEGRADAVLLSVPEGVVLTRQ